MSEEDIITVIISVLIAATLFLSNKFLINRHLLENSPDLSKEKLGLIYSCPEEGLWYGIGTSLYGNYRRNGNSYVSYHFFCILFIPIFPMGCYRRDLNGIHGSVKWNWLELLSTYFFSFSVGLMIFAIVYSIIVITD